MGKCKLNEMKRIRPTKNTLYDWLINFIPEAIRKSVGGFKDKTASLFKTNTPKKTVYRRGKKLKKQKMQNITNPFILINENEIKDRKIKYIWTHFETEEEKKKKRS